MQRSSSWETLRITSAAGSSDCKKHNVHMEDGSFSAALLVKELVKGALEANHLNLPIQFRHGIDEGEAQRFDDTLTPQKKMAAEPGGVLHPRKRILVNGIGRGRNSRGRLSDSIGQKLCSPHSTYDIALQNQPVMLVGP